MARKSRKAVAQLDSLMPELPIAQNKTGIYVRLSIEDNGRNSKDSIQNQIAYLKEYINRNPGDFQLVQIYVDNGMTGTNFDRDGWERLIDDIKTGTINCIVAKDFSRIGRNYIEVGNYLERIFPFFGVRVVSVNDNFDSQKQSFESNMLINSLTNIVNDYYAKDISRKVVQARKIIWESGEYTGGVYPYGYKKSDINKRKMSVDTESADVVKKIFEWRIQGKSSSWIVNSLNELAIPSPGLYRFMQGNKSFKNSCNSKWKIAHVSYILKNPVYLGHMVQGKSRRSYLLNDGKKQYIPKEDWVISKNTHEPLVTQEQFDLVADMAKESYKRYCHQKNTNVDIPHIENPLRRKIYCGQCGCMMLRRSKVRKGIRNYYYYCNSRRRRLDIKCTQSMIYEVPLMETLRTVTSQQLELFEVMLKQWNNNKKDSNNNKQDVEENIQQASEQEILLIKRKRRELYEDMKDGILTREDFEYENEQLSRTLLQYKNESKKIRSHNVVEKKAIKSLNRYYNEAMRLEGKELPLDLLDHLIEKVVVQSSGQIDITFAYTNILEKWCEELQIQFSNKKEETDNEP